MVSCSSNIVKIILGVFNLIWMILGGGVIFIGVQLIRWDDDYSNAIDLANINLKSVSFFIFAIGAVIALVSFLGFFGACCENSFMLNAYAFLMVLMVGLQIFALVYSIQNNNDIGNEITTGIRKAIHEINRNNHTAYVLELLQYNFHCCGWTGAKDYDENADQNRSESVWQVPASCCGVKPRYSDRANTQCASNDTKLFHDGCQHKLHLDKIDTVFQTSIGVGVVVIMLEIILIFAACCLAREFRY